MKTRKNHILFYSIVLVLLSLALLVTCKAGLGESVDTKPPTITVSYPPSKSIIRDWFYIGGVADDETYVKEVTVLFKGLDSLKGQVFGPYKAEVNKEKKQWSLKANDPSGGKFPILDGSYEVTIVGTDSAGRKTTVSNTVYTIDNTPPLLILDRPSTKGDLGELIKYDAFGSDIIFSGAWYDENLTQGALLKIHFYDKDGNEIGSEYEYPLNQPTVNLILAEDTDSSDVWNNLAGLAEDGPKEIWYSIEIFDSAYRYQNFNEASVDETGNAASHYYLSRDINNELEPTDRYPKLGDFSAVVSGRSVAGFPSTLEDALKSIKIATGFDNDNNENRGSFSFDPGNKEPVISILALPIPSDEPNPSDNKLSPLPTLDIRIEPNKDGVAIDEDTIKISLTPFDDKGKLVNNKEVFKDLRIGVIGATVTVDLPINKNEGSYQLEIEAKDKQENTVLKKYGFYINTGAPVLESVSPDRSGETKINSTNDKFRVKVKGSDDSNDVKLHITDKENQAIRDIPLKGTAAGSSRFSFEWDVQLDAPKEGETKTFRFYLSDGDFESSKREITFLTDNIPPELIRFDEPKAKDSGHVAEGKAVVSDSTINVKGYASSDLEALVFYITKDEQTPPTALSGWVEGSRANNTIKVGEEDAREFNGTLPLASFGHSAEGSYTLWARFADDTFDNELQNYGAATKLIDVIYDKSNPVLTENSIPSDARVFKNSSFNLTGKASDANPIHSFKLFETYENNSETEHDLTIESNGDWSYSPESQGDGIYKYTLELVDIAGNKSSLKREVFVDTVKPVVKINGSDTIAVLSNTHNFSGTVTESGSGIAKVELSFDKGANWVEPSGTAVWFFDQSFDNTVETNAQPLQVRAWDNAGNVSGVVSKNYTVDLANPVATINDPGKTSSNESVTFTGLAHDAFKTSGRKAKSAKLSITKDGMALDDVELSPDYTDLSLDNFGKWSWTLEAKTDYSNDGLYSITLIVIDEANKQASATRTMRIDTKAPDLNISVPVENQIFETPTFEIKGSASDIGGVGLASSNAVSYSLNSTNGSDGVWKTAGITGINWSASITDNDEGSKKLWVKAMDALGNEAKESVDFYYDKSDPTLTVSGTDESMVYRKDAVEFTGKASDTNELTSVTVSVNGTIQSPSITVDGDNKWSWTLPNTNEGIHALVFTATDVAGRTFSVKRNVLIDTKAPTITITKPELNELVRTSYNFTGIANDPGTANDPGSGIEKIEYSFDENAWQDAYGTSSWSFTADPGAEGEKTIYIRATDKAGNTKTSSQSFVYDKANPIVAITDSIERFTNEKFSLTGTATDSHGVASISITQKKDNELPVTVSEANFTLGDPSGPENKRKWTLSDLPRGYSDPLADGKYVYSVVATDKAGQESIVQTAMVTIDTTAPTLEITSPATGQTGPNALSGSSYLFRGTADDGEGGVGVSKIYYAITDNETAPTDLGVYASLETSGSWSFSKQLPSELAEGRGYYLYVLGEDKSGNRTASTGAKKVKFDVDLYKPTFTETETEPAITGTALVYRNANVEFGGVVSDANGIRTAMVKVNGAEKDLTLNGTSWSWTLEADTETHTKDGSYELEFIATDNVDKITSFTRNVMIDTKAPTLDITAPTSGEGVSSNSYTIRGTVDDGTGKGVSTLEYSLDNTNWTAITKAAAWSATGVNFSGVNQGSRTLWVRASDGLNDAVVKTVSFQYDTENPVLSETTSTLGEAQVNRNTAVSFGGTASDTNKLASVTVSVNGGDATPLTTTAGPWSYELPANDGTYALVFTATDVAGKTASIKRNVLIDTTKPILSEITTLTASWHKNATISVNGTASDTDGSGLAKVEYSTRPDGEADWSAWQNFALNVNNFSGMVQFSDGAANQIRIQATDLAGNVSTIADQTGIQVDTIAPSFDITSPTSIPLSNGTGSLSISIEANDEHSGANKVYAKVGSSVWGTNTELYPEYEATINESGEASLEILDLSKLATGNQRIYLRVDDNAGHFSAVTSQTILIDKTPPEVNFSEPANSAKVNKTISLAGTANDTNGLGSTGVVEREVSTDNWETVTGAVFSITGTNWTVSGFNTTGFTDNTTIKIRVGIQDVAGNMDYAERSLSINQDGDRPVVRLTNVRPDGSTTLLNSSIVSGILLDDDGTVEVDNFAISEDGSDWTVASATALTASSEKALFYDVDTRSFQYAPSSGDGEKTLYFRITDAAGTTFTTPASYSSEQLSYPKAQYSTEASTATGEAVSFKVDTNPPDIHGDIHFDITDPFSFDGDGALGDDYRLLNNSLFGGTKAQFALRIRAKDAVGIGNVNLTIGSNEITTTSGTTDAEGWTIFTTSSINVSTWTTGSYTVKLDVTDNSGQKSTSTREILVDNAAPTVEIISHSVNEQVTGDLVLRGTAQDVGSAGLASVEYQVGNDEDWKSVEGSFAWNIDFTQAKSNVITTTDRYANDTHATVTSPGIWRLPIKIRVTDKAGNHKTHTHYLNIDPDGDKPIVEVMYPGNNTTLGGTVRIFGSATDNVRVKTVWMMIDVNDDGNYDSTDANYLSSKGYTVVQGPDHAYQFAVEGTASWNKSINTKGEFNPEGDTAKPIRFKVRAEDDNGTYGSWSAERTISFDNKVPQIGSTNPLKLVQYSNPDGTGDIIAERDYIANMYIRGQWYLTGSVWDESGIKAISVTGSASATLGGSNTGWFVEDGTVGVYKNYQLKIPVGKSLTNETAGQLNYTIKVDDASEPSSSATANIYISYDNKAPVAAKIEHGEQEISTTNLITNSNRGFSMNSTVTEADSGFERLAFFFARGTGNDRRVYNPMYGTGNRTDIISALTWTEGDIPRLVVSGLTRNGEDSLQSASLENNENIRVGGLVRIAGVDRIIQSVDYGTGTVTFSPGVSTSHKTAEFAYAQIVNNMLVETGNWEGNVLKTISNDDGDGMIEAVERSGGSYHWTATIDSKNIPDGPIELHYVAYDKAGNSVAGSVTSFVSNNRPRLAKVSLGTDLSGDGQFTSNEIVKYYEALSGEEESLVNLASQDFIVKAKLAVIPEFVGGNGTLGYTWTTNGAAGDAWTVDDSMPNEALTGTVSTFDEITIDGSEHKHKAIIIEPSELTTMDDKLKLFSFGIWDKTEETTQGTDSQWALLNAPMLVDVVDGVAPKVVIRPFYWNSATDNSLYGNSKTNGHIEITGVYDGEDPDVSGSISVRGVAYDDQRISALYAKMDDYTFTDGTTGTGAFSGYTQIATYSPETGQWTGAGNMTSAGWQASISEDSFSQSGHRVSWQLDINTNHANFANIAATDRVITVSAADKANSPSSTDVQSALLTGTATRPNAVSITVDHSEDIKVNQLVILGTGDEQYARRIVSYDNGKIGLSDSVDTSITDYTIYLDGYNNPTYQVDVVPYITDVRRGGSYNTHRSKAGSYSLLRGEAENKIYGFNFGNVGTAGNNWLHITSDKAGDTNVSNITTYTVNSRSEITFTLPADARDGNLTLSVNGIRSINNISDNLKPWNKEYEASKPSSTYWYDDRYIHVWQSNTADYFAGSDNPSYPSMAMNDDGTLYASFSNYSTSMVYYSDIGGTATPVFYTFDPPEETSIIATGTGNIGSTGTQINILYSANYHGGLADSWNSSAGSAGGLYLYDDSAPLIDVGRDNRRVYRFELFYHNKMLQQFKNLRLARAAVGNGERIHVVYYDRLSQSIKYSNIEDGYTGGANTTARLNHEIAWVNIDGGSDAHDTTSFNYGYGSSIVLGSGRFTGDLSRTSGTGEIAALALNSNKYPVVVYFDADNDIIKLARANDVNPKGSQDNWQVQRVLSSGDPNSGTVADYLTAKIDSAGYLHIAFENSRSELVYIKSTNNPSDGTTAYEFGDSQIIADSATWADLTLKGTTPYISYLSRINSFDGMNIAYYDDDLDLDGDGEAEGGWEVMTAAMNYKASNIKTNIAAHPTPSTGGWTAAVGFTPGNLYRVVKFIGKLE